MAVAIQWLVGLIIVCMIIIIYYIRRKHADDAFTYEGLKKLKSFGFRLKCVQNGKMFVVDKDGIVKLKDKQEKENSVFYLGGITCILENLIFFPESRNIEKAMREKN